MKAIDIKTKIFNSEDRKKKLVNVPEWDNAELYIRELSSADVKIIYDNNKDRISMFTAIVIAGCVDEDNKHIFCEKDIDSLKDKNFNVVLRLASEIEEYSGLGNTENKEKKKIFKRRTLVSSFFFSRRV